MDNGEERAVVGKRRGRGGDDVGDAFRHGGVNGFDWTSAITSPSRRWDACRVSSLAGPFLCLDCSPVVGTVAVLSSCCICPDECTISPLEICEDLHMWSLVRSFEPGLEHVIEMTGSGRGLLLHLLILLLLMLGIRVPTGASYITCDLPSFFPSHPSHQTPSWYKFIPFPPSPALELERRQR